MIPFCTFRNPQVATNTYFANGALKTVSDEIGTTTFSYNAFGQKIQEAISSDYIIRVLSRNFDNFGREINYSIGNSKKADYIYNETNGRLKTMNAVNGGNFEFGYMENTNLQNRITYPNGVIKTTSFEEKRNLITGINYQNGANVISNYSYENDVLGRRTNIGITYDNATKSNDYNYNPRSEVIGANGDTLNQAFDYDNIGNRITSENNGTTTNYTANNLNQYENVGDFVPLFDEDGNQTKIKTSMGEWLVTYNGENRPIKFTQGTKSIEMKYDYMGRRVQYISKTGNTLNKDRRYMYNGYTLVQEMYNTNQVYMEFTWDPTAGTATKPLMLAFPTEGKNLFYFHDANKNVTEVAYMATHNGIGAHYEYDTFGNIITNTRHSLFNFDSNNINPFRFSSEYFDSELGLVYYNYRHYNPQSGRWLSRDPIEEKGGNNLYGMCKNNLIRNWDYLGFFGDGQRIDPNNPQGHGDFHGHEFFDYTKEDHDWTTHPFNPVGLFNHFQPYKHSYDDAVRAMNFCDPEEFQRAMHRLQDYETHYGKGYRPIGGKGWLGHAIDGVEPDNDPNAWKNTNKLTKDFIDAWNEACVLCDGQWKRRDGQKITVGTNIGTNINVNINIGVKIDVGAGIGTTGVGVGGGIGAGGGGIGIKIGVGAGGAHINILSDPPSFPPSFK